MSLLFSLKSKALWEEFFSYKENGGHLPSAVKNDLREFIDKNEFLPVADNIIKAVPLPLPSVVQLNKKSTQKKRTVFTFERNENYVLKLLSYLLYSYDGIFSANLYSFRRGIGVKHAVRSIINHPEIADLYSYKVDIHDYFNSVDTDIMLDLLNHTLGEDKPLLRFFTELLSQPLSLKDGCEVVVSKGIMAGIPVAGFMANLYLSELDNMFFEKGILYARYSDDIIVFANSADKIALYEKTIKDFLAKHKLQINPKKEFRTVPGECWEFLGFSYIQGKTDISAVSKEKLKAKMRRRARAIVRWKRGKKVTDEKAVKAYINFLNKKFYDNPIHNDLTWCKWYFPVITTSETLSVIDDYAINCIRYVATGKHTKSNYNLRYEKIKELGYRSLVNEYYRFKKTHTFHTL